MDEGEIGHHHAKRLGLIHTAENLPADSLQFVGDLVCQREYERGVDTLKRNVQPRAIVERKNLRLCRLALEIHDDALSQGVLVPDLQYSKKLAEMSLRKLGIDGESNLGTLLCGSNDSTFRSGCRLLRRGHISLLS